MDDKFKKIITLHESYLKKYNASFSLVGNIKLFLVLILAASVYITLSKGLRAELVTVDIFELMLFIIFWIYHGKLHKKINYSKGIININKRHLDRLSGQWHNFTDAGEEFSAVEHPYANDLDIVGKKSLFQFLNAAYTWHGRQQFAKDLLYPEYSNTELKKRQEAVMELSKDIEFSNHMEYYLSKTGASDSIVELVNDLNNKSVFIKQKPIRAILTFLPVFTLIFIAGIAIFQLTNFYTAGAVLTLIQSLIWVIGLPKAQLYLVSMSSTPYKLSTYSQIIEILRNKEFSSEKLKGIQEQLNNAAQAIKDLGKISDKLSFRENGVACFVLNVFLLWDFECAFMLETWKEKYGGLAEKWFLSLGEFESLLSFSNLALTCDNVCIPTFAGSKKMIEADELGHPLLLNEKRVNNNFKCNDNIFIISGSNMSGKTTFLRTIGINLILANAGSFVCARQMTFSSFKIMTSMRIADDLSEGVSTFYAELRRIKAIIELAEKEPDMLFLIDEIFRGTNSVDRLSGAKTIISKLNELKSIGMISTHDLELCELAKQSLRIKNYSFSESYANNKICFDYILREGKSSTTNAEYLMKMVGILD